MLFLGLWMSCATARTADNPLLGLPPAKTPIAHPPNTAEVALGRKLFFDARLSSDGAVSCAECHQPVHIFADAKEVAQGKKRPSGSRNTPSLVNAAFNGAQFWDGRATSLEDQALRPFVNPIEHGLKSAAALLAKIDSDAKYREEFRAAYGAKLQHIEIEQIARAISAFERTLLAGDSPFDRYRFEHDANALSKDAERGLILFEGRAQCASCHTIGRDFALFTDGAFHNQYIGLQKIGTRLGRLATEYVARRSAGADADALIVADAQVSELGRFAVTENPADLGQFRTPSLRNVELTAPYMHDGSVASLNEAVSREIYVRGDRDGRPLILTPQEQSDLVEFLKALTSSARSLRHLAEMGSPEMLHQVLDVTARTGQ